MMKSLSGTTSWQPQHYMTQRRLPAFLLHRSLTSTRPGTQTPNIQALKHTHTHTVTLEADDLDAVEGCFTHTLTLNWNALCLQHKQITGCRW